MRRIENYKNQLSRSELLTLGEEATAELHGSDDDDGQLVLTEVLLADMVDRLIIKRLGLKPFSRWRKQFLKLRTAQREPNHWGVDRSHPAAVLLPRIEPGDQVLAIGAAAESSVYLLLAHDAVVTFVAGDLGCIERVETKVGTEALGTEFAAFVTQLGEWLPPFNLPIDLVIIDAGALAELSFGLRRALIQQVQVLTAPGGIHAIIPGENSVAPEGYLSHYPDWSRLVERPQDRRRAGVSHGVMVTRPEALPSTTPAASQDYA